MLIRTPDTLISGQLIDPFTRPCKGGVSTHVAFTTGRKMVRKLKFHEKKLLKKVDFISWKADNNVREIQIIKKYHLQKREDYTK